MARHHLATRGPALVTGRLFLWRIRRFEYNAALPPLLGRVLCAGEPTASAAN